MASKDDVLKVGVRKGHELRFPVDFGQIGDEFKRSGTLLGFK